MTPTKIPGRPGPRWPARVDRRADRDSHAHRAASFGRGQVGLRGDDIRRQRHRGLGLIEFDAGIGYVRLSFVESRLAGSEVRLGGPGFQLVQFRLGGTEGGVRVGNRRLGRRGVHGRWSGLKLIELGLGRRERILGADETRLSPRLDPPRSRPQAAFAACRWTRPGRPGLARSPPGPPGDRPWLDRFADRSVWPRRRHTRPARRPDPRGLPTRSVAAI